VKKVLQALVNGGYVVLKSATDLNKPTDKQCTVSNEVDSSADNSEYPSLSVPSLLRWRMETSELLASAG